MRCVQGLIWEQGTGRSIICFSRQVDQTRRDGKAAVPFLRRGETRLLEFRAAGIDIPPL